MLCENCKKNTANTHIKKIVNGSVQEYHLCGECAKKLGFSDGMGNISKFMGFGANSLFGSLFSDSLAGSLPATEVKRCPGCGISFDDIAKTGLCGCPECYTTFYDQLLPSLSRIHGKLEHLGKVSAASSKSAAQIKAESLEAELKQAVSEQRYEDAAKLRDEIAEIKKEINGEEK